MGRMTARRTDYRYRTRAADQRSEGQQTPKRRPRARTRLRPASLLLLVLVAMVGLAIFAGARVLGPERDRGNDRTPDATSTGDPSASPREPVPTPAEEGLDLAIPSYLGTETRRTYGDGKAPEKLDLIWKVKIGSGLTARKSDSRLVTWAGTGWTGQPTLVIENGVPYLLIGGYDHGLRRIDARSGTVVWRAGFDDVIKGTNTVYFDPRRPRGDRTVVVSGSRRGNGLDIGDPRIAPLRAVSFASGAELWRLPVPRTKNYSQDVDASPLWLDGRLIAALEPGYVVAIDPGVLSPGPDGHPRPSVVATSPLLYTPADVRARPDVGAANVAVEGSPAVLGDRIYVATGSGHVYGLNRVTLAIEWDFNPGGDFDSTVTVTRDGRLLVGLEREYIKGHGGAFLLDPAKPPAEAVVWFFPTADRGIGEWQGGIVGSIAINDEYLPEDGGGRLAAFTSVDGNVYVVSVDETDGTAKGPDGKTAYPKPKLVFSDRIGGSISTPAFARGALVAAGYDNRVHLYRIDYAAASEGVAVTNADGSSTSVGIRETDTFEAGAAFESTPLVWGGRVYLGSRDGYLYCLGAK